MHELSLWTTFFVIVATAAATLVGLMFVVITLIQGSVQPGDRTNGFAAFTTPTLMLFCSALLTSLVLIAPWRHMNAPAILLVVAGLCGVVYAARVALLARKLETYEPDAEDTVWYSVLPFLVYAAQLAGGVLLSRHAANGLDVIAAESAASIFIGIRNAWDIVTYLAVRR